MELSSCSLGVSLKNITFGSGLQVSKSKVNRKEDLYLGLFFAQTVVLWLWWWRIILVLCWNIWTWERRSKSNNKILFYFWQLVYEMRSLNIHLCIILGWLFHIISWKYSWRLNKVIGTSYILVSNNLQMNQYFNYIKCLWI